MNFDVMDINSDFLFYSLDQHSTEVSLPFFTSVEKGTSQQVELRDEGGEVGGGADRQFERSSLNFSSQRSK